MQVARSQHSRVLIVGAGPGGTATALALAQAGVRDVTLIDAHDFPRDKTCGSALSPRGIAVCKQLGVWERILPKAHAIHGIRLVTPGGYDESLNGGGEGEVQAVICLRRHLDHELLKAAVDCGVNFVPNVRAREPILKGPRWVGVTARDGQQYRADHVVVANGAHSTFTFDERPKKIIHTIMGWWQGVEYEPHLIEMVFDRDIEPYYGWLFPEGDDRVNIGITYEDDGKLYKARERFTRFLDKYYAPRLRKAKPLGRWQGHPISYTYVPRDLWSPGRVIVGEAGRMTHPLTGEGIAQAMRSGCFAAEALADILLRDAEETRALRAYERRCQRAFTASQVAGGVLRGVMRTRALDWVVGLSSNPRVKNAAATMLAHV